MSTLIDTGIDHLIDDIDELDQARLSIYTGPRACHGCGVILEYLSRQHLPLYWEADDASILEVAERFVGAKIVEAPPGAIPVSDKHFDRCRGGESDD